MRSPGARWPRRSPSPAYCRLAISGVVALFGNEAFRTLPFYLYQQIGAYRSQDGAVTAPAPAAALFLVVYAD
ncbi:hypothetical protein LNP05_06935 [Klebsiella pneumoniae subsp. pneumoniae]|nr:hypothetical protein [Klebsiella pneumoniae subsp. pneumoniae]